MTYAESLGSMPMAIALVLITRNNSTLRCTCFSPEDICSAVRLANSDDSVKVQVL